AVGGVAARAGHVHGGGAEGPEGAAGPRLRPREVRRRREVRPGHLQRGAGCAEGARPDGGRDRGSRHDGGAREVVEARVEAEGAEGSGVPPPPQGAGRPVLLRAAVGAAHQYLGQDPEHERAERRGQGRRTLAVQGPRPRTAATHRPWLERTQDRGRRGRTVRGRHGEGRRPVPEVEGPQGRPQDRPRDLEGVLGRAGDVMLSSPYPVPPSRWHTAILVVSWIVGGLTAPWIIGFPPITYQGLGLVASYGWGVMFGVGAVLIALANAVEEYRIEIPGIALALGGLVVYDILSWHQVATGSTGSGSRALIFVPFMGVLLARLLRLLGHHRKIRGLQRIARGADGADCTAHDRGRRRRRRRRGHVPREEPPRVVAASWRTGGAARVRGGEGPGAGVDDPL